eukprot:4146971-Alexandrium_andersonii.AAC.1
MHKVSVFERPERPPKCGAVTMLRRPDKVDTTVNANRPERREQGWEQGQGEGERAREGRKRNKWRRDKLRLVEAKSVRKRWEEMGQDSHGGHIIWSLQ